MRRTALTASLLAIVTAGCGSTELSDKQLRTRATRVCRLASIRTDRIGTPSSPSGGAAFLKSGVAVLGPEYKQLRALRPPSDLAQVYKISIDAFSQKLEALGSAVRQLDHGADPVIAMKTLQQRLGPLESSENGAWRALQVPACLNR